MAGHLTRGRRKPTKTQRKQLRAAYGIPEESWDEPYEEAAESTKAVNSAGRIAKRMRSRAAKAEPEAVGEGDVRSRAVQLSELVSKLMADANRSAIATERSKIVARAVAALTLLGRMTGESSDMPEQRIVRFPAVRRVLMAVVEAVSPWPAAHRAVLDTLKRFG